MDNLCASLWHLQTRIYSCFNSVAYVVAFFTIWEALYYHRQPPGTYRYDSSISWNPCPPETESGGQMDGVFETWKSFLTHLYFLPFYPNRNKQTNKKKPQQNKNLRKSVKLIIYKVILVSHGRYVIQLLQVNLKVSTLVLYMCATLADNV